jgi:hypothetical protein
MSPLVLPPPMLASAAVMSPLALPAPMLGAKSAPAKVKVRKCLMPEEKSAYRISGLDFVQLKKKLLALKKQRGE